MGLISVIELEGELEASRIVSCGHRAEVVVDDPSITEAGKVAHVVELRVIPSVETLSAKLKAHSAIVQVKVLEQRQVPVVPARASEGVIPQISELPRCGRSETSRAEPLICGLWITASSAEVGSVQAGDSSAEVPLCARVQNSSLPDRQGCPGLHCNYPRYLPSAQR